MHSYSITDITNANERSDVTFKLVAISSVLSAIISFLLSAFSKNYFILSAVTAPSTFVIYLFIFKIFNQHLWKTKIGSLFGVTTPNLNGLYTGSIEFKSYNGNNYTNNTVELEIKQTWTHIGVNFQTNKTSSNSSSASIEVDGNNYNLRYLYHAKSSQPQNEEFPEYQGTTTVTFNPRKSEVKLTNYTNHNEKGSGVLKLQPQQT